MNGQQDGTGAENTTATGDSAPTESQALSNRFPIHPLPAIWQRADGSLHTDGPAFLAALADMNAYTLMPDPRTTTEVPF